MSSLEIRIILYGILALGMIGASAYATHRLDAAHYEALQLEVAQNNANAQDAARIALQDQIDRANAQDAANAKIVADLTTRASSAESDLTFAHKLLAAATAASPGSGPKQQVPDQSGTPPGSAPAGLAALAGACAAVKSEDDWNGNQLDALIAELKPQL